MFVRLLILFHTISFAITLTVNIHTSDLGCSIFANKSRFYPNDIFNEKWYVLYYVADKPTDVKFYTFSYPLKREEKTLKRFFKKIKTPVRWTGNNIVMENDKGEVTLLVPRKDVGEYTQYSFKNGCHSYKVHLKHTADNNILAYMNCDRNYAIVMSRGVRLTVGYKDNEGRALHEILSALLIDDRPTYNEFFLDGTETEEEKLAAFGKYMRHAMLLDEYNIKKDEAKHASIVNKYKKYFDLLYKQQFMAVLERI